MSVAMMNGGGGTNKLTKLKSVSFSISTESTQTITTVNISLSDYNVKNKTIDDFVLGIEALNVSTNYSESRKVSSIKITKFDGTKLTVVCNHEYYTHHAQQITFTVGIYCVM